MYFNDGDVDHCSSHGASQQSFPVTLPILPALLPLFFFPLHFSPFPHNTMLSLEKNHKGILKRKDLTLYQRRKILLKKIRQECLKSCKHKSVRAGPFLLAKCLEECVERTLEQIRRATRENE